MQEDKSHSHVTLSPIVLEASRNVIPKAALARGFTFDSPPPPLRLRPLSSDLATPAYSRAAHIQEVSSLLAKLLLMSQGIVQHHTIRSQSQAAHVANRYSQQRRHCTSRSLLQHPRSRARLSQPTPPTKSSQAAQQLCDSLHLPHPNQQQLRPPTHDVCPTISFARRCTG